MPSYTFKNLDTGEIFEKSMKISELDSYKQQNPMHERYFDAAPAFTGDHITAVKKYDTGFKEVLQRIHEKTPGSQLDKSSSQL
jgi:hypothetical protein